MIASTFAAKVLVFRSRYPCGLLSARTMASGKRGKSNAIQTPAQPGSFEFRIPSFRCFFGRLRQPCVCGQKLETGNPHRETVFRPFRGLQFRGKSANIRDCL